MMMRAPITLLTGAIGSGKTTLMRRLIEQMKDTTTFALVSNTVIERREVVLWILNALGLKIDPQGTYVMHFQMLQDFLIAEYAAGRRVVAIFDEAQNLSPAGLEEVRMLTNINSGADELLQLILVGQPELRETILAPELVQLAQRISVRAHLKHMDRQMVANYVAHRLRVSGGHGDEMTEGALDLIFRTSKGVPRLINQIAEMAMTYAYAGTETQITEQLIQQVLDDEVLLVLDKPLVLNKPYVGDSG
jgi:type II secretory pathway predicted ATPase ExeA